MAHPNAAERVRRRIIEWAKQYGHGAKKKLADAVSAKYGDTKSQSWATDLTRHDGSDLRLRDLDAIADVMGIAPGDLVRRDNALYVEITTSEHRLLQYFRTMPDVIRGHCLAYLDYIFSFQQRSLEEQAKERAVRTARARAAAETNRKKA